MSERSHFKHFMRDLTRIIVRFSGIYGGIFHDVLLLVSGQFGLRVPKELQRDSIDKRLNRLDEARDALSDTLTAVTELRDEIEEGKQEHQRVLAELARTLASKESADSKLESLRKLVQADKDTLREVTAPQNVARQHTIGFFLGILASLVATGLFFAAPIAREAFASWNTAELSGTPDAARPPITQNPEIDAGGR
jgi:uncharacterized membrane-anchored protein YhcB (DUF1043 family)